MKEKKSKNFILILMMIFLNIVAVTMIAISVSTSVTKFKNLSFNQNVENIATLTESSASRASIEAQHYTGNVKINVEYINNYNNGVGMTEEELKSYFQDFYENFGVEWQLINSFTTGTANSTNEKFSGICLSEEGYTAVNYGVISYPKLAQAFCLARDESNLGKITYIYEFTDQITSNSCFAVSSPVKLRVYDEQTATNSYNYKTLMLVVQREKMNSILENNNETNSAEIYNFANAIISLNGDYLFSNVVFQGTNLFRFLELYDSNFTESIKNEMIEKIKDDTINESPYYFKNNRGQDCIYTFAHIENTNWHVVSVVPISSFHNVDNYSLVYLNFFVSCMFLFVVNIVFMVIFNIKLRKISKEAQVANVAKSQFLSSMSHDIRTPMNAIVGMTLIANDNLKEEKPDYETIKDCIKTIELSGNHLLTLINDILDISKIESGKVTLAEDKFSILDSLNRMIEIMQPKIKEKDFKFSSHIFNVNHEFVCGDELRLNQVYINILSNAVKYTNPGGEVTIELREDPIEGQNDKARYTFIVKDNGIGMSDAFQKTIFERFSRAVDTRINSIQGTGLGLAITKQLVDLMGGTISVDSKLNVGSTFTISVDLPVVNATYEKIDVKDLSALLIDDDEILLETAETCLKSFDIKTRKVTNGKDALKLVKEMQKKDEKFDIIFVDWKMDGISGVELIKELRKVLTYDAKIVVMTAYNIADVEHDARIAGANAFVSKPLYKSKLLNQIKTLYLKPEEKSASKEEETFDLNILVAEDNDLNWKVLSKILSKYNLSPDRAENGQQAVDAIEKGKKKYDLILMDIQMPILNGYEATERIRKLGNKTKASTPIYAMTADTFAEDIARCLEKGMNGHLAKPIDVDKLLKVLRIISSEKK